MSKNPRQFLLLVSPPASGKTHWISLLQLALGGPPMLVIAPLRALADECRSRWKNSVTVMTPEEWLTKKNPAEIVIFDELHLYFYWGDSFRPAMWEAFYEIAENTPLVIGLTATLSPEMTRQIASFSSSFGEIWLADFGNRTLRTSPEIYLKAPSKRWLLEEIYREKKSASVKLVFCQYREEVHALTRELRHRGFNCLSCVGGEAAGFRGKLAQNPTPDFIVSTSVLSHGVNLPPVTRIYFLYALKNVDFWIQMVARGGRRGEKFQVLSLEKPFQLRYHPVGNALRVFLRELRRKWSRPEPFLLR